MQKFKRTKKLVNKSLQLKMIAVFTAIGCTCALFQVVLVNHGLLSIARSAPSGGDEILRQARGMMLQNVVWTLGAMIPLMTCIGIVLTHRVAGPAYRLREHCKAIAAGGPVTKCSIRKHDELQDLCDAMNAAFDRIAPAKTDGETTEAWNLEDAPTLLSTSSSTTGDSTKSEAAEATQNEEEATA